MYGILQELRFYPTIPFSQRRYLMREQQHFGFPEIQTDICPAVTDQSGMRAANRWAAVFQKLVS
jgi:hypothetical protein